jgi:uncharacterized protein (DUF1800 family)
MDDSRKVTHVLSRLSLGPRPSDRQQVEQMGVEAYIQAQLAPDSLPEPATLSARLDALSTLQLSELQLFEQSRANNNASDNVRRQAGRKRAEIFQQAVQARLLRALESPRQLQEVMVDFWFNHFNVFEGKNLTGLWIQAYERSAIRPHALGKFGELLLATAKHPAMLFYLDNWRNSAPEGDRARGPFRGLNENYARELLELHTLGVDGGYSQADVESLARILTGWSMVHPQQPVAEQNGFIFVSDRHDPSDKTLLGKAIRGGGVEEGEAAIAWLAQQPATARHISYKLAQYFVADTPPETLTNRLSERFLATTGDLKAVLQTLFASDEFWQESTYQRKFKTPYQYLLSINRAVGVTSPPEAGLRQMGGFMNQLGMPLYRCAAPDGYAQVEASWLNADAVMRRVSLAVATVNRQASARATEPDDLLETLSGQISPETRAIVNDAPVNLRAALLLGSPDMMYR